LPYNHAIWHVFVLGGCASHYIAVIDLVLWLSWF
jgi:predicted membrane channel-forming protein YqfA (hemolysin III family)